jgi:hypothetical protein
MVAGWLQREQGEVTAYLKEENKLLREQLGETQIKFTDSQRRRLARRGKRVGRRGLLVEFHFDIVRAHRIEVVRI